MNNITRHNFSADNKGFRSSYFAEKIDKLKKSIEFNPQNSGLNFKHAFYAVGDSIATNYSKKEILDFLNLAVELGINYLRNTIASPNSTIVMSLRGEDFEVQANPNNTYSNAYYWQLYFYCAIITRNRKSISELINFPEETLRSSEIVYDEIDFASIRFLKGLYQEVKLAPILLEAIKLTSHELNDKERYDYLDYIKLPELELYTRIFSNDNKGFNEALAGALESHKKYWSKDPNDTEGWISFPLIAACMVAVETHNFNIEVTSDYLPMWLITGESQ